MELEKDPQVKMKIKDMLDEHNREPQNYQSKIG